MSSTSPPPARSAGLPRCLVAGLTVAACLGTLAAAEQRRPIAITVDDLPISSARLHPDPAQRLAITRGMLDTMARHGIRAVGLVTWGNMRDDEDLKLLELWLEAGHELGNHSHSHPDYTGLSAEDYVADMERARTELVRFLEPRGESLRFFRFPMLREGETVGKLEAMRAYLDRSGQRNLPVTIDNQDGSYERPWVAALRSGDQRALRDVGEDFQASLRIAVRHHERTGDRLFGRPLPQILLLHATAVGAAQWERLFGWLVETGHRFATADEVLGDPVFDEPHRFVGPRGFGLWDRLADRRLRESARSEIEGVLELQAAAWNRGDLETFCSVYADDAVFLSESGVQRGRAEILERYHRRYGEDRTKLGTLGFEVVDVRFASGIEVSQLGDARPSRVHGVSVAARWRLRYADKDDLSGLTLLVFRPDGEGWRIVQDASM